MAKKKSKQTKKPASKKPKAKKKPAPKNKGAAKGKGKKDLLKQPLSSHDAATLAAVEHMSFLARNPEASYNHACELLSENYDELMEAIGNCRGLEIGLKKVAGCTVPMLAIRILVDKKVAEGDIGPKGNPVPKVLLGLPTDVIERATFKMCAGGDPGTSIQVSAPAGSKNGNVSVGTQVFVSGKIHYLTCGHIVKKGASAGVKSVSAGTTPAGSLDTSSSSLFRLSSTIDCALVESSQTTPRVRLRDGATVVVQPGSATGSDLVEGTPVWKRGAKTDVTRGKIVALTTDTREVEGFGEVRQHILIEPDGPGPFADEGDSGSLVNIGPNAVGIVRAVSETGEVLATPMMAVRREMQRFRF